MRRILVFFERVLSERLPQVFVARSKPARVTARGYIPKKAVKLGCVSKRAKATSGHGDKERGYPFSLSSEERQASEDFLAGKIRAAMRDTAQFHCLKWDSPRQILGCPIAEVRRKRRWSKDEAHPGGG